MTLMMCLVSFSIISKAQENYSERGFNDSTKEYLKNYDKIFNSDSIHYCSNHTQKTIDKFTNNICISSYIDRNLFIMKSIIDKDTSYYLALNSYSSELFVGKKGVIVLFADGDKLQLLDEKIKVEVNKYKKREGEDYKYHCFVTISKEDIKIFIKKTISDYRLYILDSNILPSDGEEFRRLVKCVSLIN